MQSIVTALWRNRRNLRELARVTRPRFAQFGEDVAIASLLHPGRCGTYVDVGANHPFRHSNTAYLYARGWCGLAIDPNPAFTAAFRRRRPRDTVLNVGVSAQAGTLTYFEFADHTFNTFAPERAEQLRREGRPPVRERAVPCRPLRELIRQHLGTRHVDLLSVDCEGLDLEVLRSADLAASRPTVLIVEDFGTYSAFRDGGERGDIDRFLRGHDYSPVYQCAWSSIYVADDWREHPISGAFDPPRGRDDYMPGRVDGGEFAPSN